MQLGQRYYEVEWPGEPLSFDIEQNPATDPYVLTWGVGPLVLDHAVERSGRKRAWYRYEVADEDKRKANFWGFVGVLATMGPFAVALMVEVLSWVPVGWLY
jgi:hypothetical protein